MKNSFKACYTAFGLNVLSEVPLPELCLSERDNVEVIIKLGELHDKWSNFGKEKARFLIRENFVLFNMDDTAIFSISEGKEIVISPIEGASLDKIRLFLLGTCFGILLMQRGVLPLHGSAISINGKAYAFVGDSGAGKSTLAAAFIKRGYKLVSDDVIAINFSDDEKPIVTPSYPQQKLWQESLNHFDMECTKYRPIFERETKFSVPVTSNYFNEPLPLGGVFELVKKENNDISINPINKLESLQTLYNHTYRQFLISSLGLLQWHFDLSAKVISKIDMYQLCRPLSYFSANELTSQVLSTLKMKEGIKI